MHRIPVSILSKMSMYEIELQGAKVMVSVVDDMAVVGSKMDEFKSSLPPTSHRRVVGLDIKRVRVQSI
jgi:hypothetical protein